MKVKQVVGEHKKGFRAKKYARKPINTITPKKPEAPVSEGTPVPVGKVNAVNPDGTISITDPQGNQMNVDKQALVPGPNGTLTMTGSSTQAVAPGTQVMGSSDQATEEGIFGSAPPPEAAAKPNLETFFVDFSTGKPMAKTGGIAGEKAMSSIEPSKLWSNLTPEVEAKAKEQAFSKVAIQVNGKTIFGLKGGPRIIVSPQDYQQLSAGAPAIRESADDELLEKMRTIAGLR